MQFSQLNLVVSITLFLNVLSISLPIVPSTRSLLSPASAQSVGDQAQLPTFHLDRVIQVSPVMPPRIELPNNRWRVPDELLQQIPAAGFNHQNSDRPIQPPLAQAVNSRLAEAGRLLDQGVQQMSKSQYQDAFQSWQQALVIYREDRVRSEQPLISRSGEASALMNLGTLYWELNRSQQAIEYFQQALPIFQELGHRSGEAVTLLNWGAAYKQLEQYQKLIDYSKQALTIFRELGDRLGEAKVLVNLGVGYTNLGEYQRGIEYYQQALPIHQEVNDRSGEATVLTNLGNAYGKLNGYQKGIEYYRQALPIFRELGDRNMEGFLLANIGRLYANYDSPQSAIQFLQQSVEVREFIRKQMQQLPQAVQQSYVDSFASDYQLLADLLKQQSRRTEAQQILDLLK